MAHYDILAFINDLFWIFFFFSFFFFMIDELFLKKFVELTFLKHYIYIENVWVKVFIFNKFFSAYSVFLRKYFFKRFTFKRFDLTNLSVYVPFSSEIFTETVFERRSKEKFLKRFKQRRDTSFAYLNFCVFFLSIW